MTDEQSIRDAAAKWIAGLISGNGFGDDYVDDEVTQWADDLLSSPVIRRIREEAWDQAVEEQRLLAPAHEADVPRNPHRAAKGE